jgi:selenocysteine lyase/cysteine desulfurase
LSPEAASGVKPHYGRFLKSMGARLHFAAHVAHPWPDATRDAHLAAWDDAAAQAEAKWEKVVGKVLPEAQRAASEALGWRNPGLVAFAPTTHELILRLLSCLPAGRAPRVLTTDSESYSFARQAARLEEEGSTVDRVPVEPFGTFKQRFVDATKTHKHDFVFLSQVFFGLGHRLLEKELAEIAAAAAPEAVVVFEGSDALMAVPLDLSPVLNRCFYMAEGGRFAQAGEGVALLAVPPGVKARPMNTGWFSDVSGAEKGSRPPVGYGAGGLRFWGAPFDPTALYRWNAVMAWRASAGITVQRSDAHARALQTSFLARLAQKARGPLKTEALVSTDLARLGHFLSFRIPDAPAAARKLLDLGVVADARGGLLRFGFGLYQDLNDVDELFRRLDKL